MTIKEKNEDYNELLLKINDMLLKSVNPSDSSVVYELDQDSINEGSYDYYIDAYNNNGATYEMSVEKVLKNGTITGYMAEIGTDWTIYVSDIYKIDDKLQILNIFNDK